MRELFRDSKFNGDISEWDVSKVTDMTEMFMNSEFNGDISKWDVSKVESTISMFQGSKFNGDISKWNLSNNGDFSWMVAQSPLSEKYTLEQLIELKERNK